MIKQILYNLYIIILLYFELFKSLKSEFNKKKYFWKEKYKFFCKSRKNELLTNKESMKEGSMVLRDFYDENFIVKRKTYWDFNGYNFITKTLIFKQNIKDVLPTSLF